MKRVSAWSREILDRSREFLWLSEYVFQKMSRGAHLSHPSRIPHRGRAIGASAKLAYATERVSEARITGVARRDVTGFRNWTFTLSNPYLVVKLTGASGRAPDLHAAGADAQGCILSSRSVISFQAGHRRLPCRNGDRI